MRRANETKPFSQDDMHGLLETLEKSESDRQEVITSSIIHSTFQLIFA